MKIYDLIIIGGGPAGYSAALEGARSGAKVALLEKEYLGGTCLNKGCIPTKTLLESVKVLEKLHTAKEYGIDFEGSAVLNKADLLSRKIAVTEKLRNGLDFLLTGAKIDIIRENGKLSGKGKVAIDNTGREVITGKKIIIATGSREAVPKLEGAGYMATSKDALELKSIPKDICIIGGGVVGMEFATFYAGAGSKVHVLEALPNALNTEDREIAGLLAKSMRDRGIEIRENCMVKSVEKHKTGYTVHYETKGEACSLKTDMVLNAVGRKPNTEGIGLETCGIKCDARGFIPVNEFLQTASQDIYAAGDVIGAPLLAHAAFDEGITAARNALGNNCKRAGLKNIPRCIYTHPEIGAVGLTEEQAKEKGIKIKKGYYPLSANSRALVSGNPEGMVKIIADADIKQVIGVHILGENATEIIGSAVYAVEGEFTCEELSEYIMAHPTVSEVIKEAADDCRRK